MNATQKMIGSRWCLGVALLFGFTGSTAFAQMQSATAAPATVDGYWRMLADRHDGTFRETFFLFHQNGEAITGTMMNRNPKGQPMSGTLHDGHFHIEDVPKVSATPRPASAGPLHRLVYDGTFANGKLHLRTANKRGDVSEGDAEPTTEAATKPPAPLPLPAPRDLPDNGLARTPPLGWNSWNHFGLNISDSTVRGIADAMVSSGMRDAGYTYVNIDDAWEGNRDSAGNITSNTRFPDMKALADYVHSRGLKIGLYSGPGPKTCGEYEGSFGHEEQDARTYAAWGIDWLKYDLCSATLSYADTRENVRGLYQKMGEALQATHRPILYSLCEYGHHDVWEWGASVGGNIWRTTVDINDSWASMDDLGFKQLPLAKFNRPGHWNDPDMLEIGNGGLNHEEMLTHMSLWSMLSAPLMAGNDLRSMSDEVKSILTNREVLAIDQDPAAKPATLLGTEPGTQKEQVTLVRPLTDGSVVVGLFNRSGAPAAMAVQWKDVPGIPKGRLAVRDLWLHQLLSGAAQSLSATVPAHGVVLVRVSLAK